MFGNFATIIIITLLYLTNAENSYIIPTNSTACGPYSDYQEPNSCVCHEGYKIDSSGLCQPFCNYCDHGICVDPDECNCLQGYEKTGQVIEKDEIIDICVAKLSTKGSSNHDDFKCLPVCDCWNELDPQGEVIDSRACLLPCSGHLDEPCLNITDCKCESNRLMCDYFHEFSATYFICNRQWYNLHLGLAIFFISVLVVSCLFSLIMKRFQRRRRNRSLLVAQDEDEDSNEETAF